MASQLLGADGNTVAAFDATTGAQKVLIVDPLGNAGGGIITTLNNSLSAVNASAVLNVAGASGVSLQTAGTFSATVILEGTVDGTTWYSLTGYSIQLLTTTTNITTASINYFQVAGLAQVRCRCTAYTSGTVVVSIRATPGSAIPYTPSVIAAAQFTKITDGTTAVAVKAASTAAVATDPGVVVSLSPNLPAPTLHTLESAATTNATSVKASAGRITNLVITSPLTTATVRYFKLYNKASAPTVGTDTPVITLPIVTTTNGVNVVTLPVSDLGLYFSTGIAYAITGAATTADTTAVAAGDVKVFMNYI